MSEEHAAAGKLIWMLLRPGADPGGRPCLVGGGRSYTRRQAESEVARCIDLLKGSGIATGHRVLALLDHDAQGVFFLAAASALGLRIMMPYNLQAAALPEWLGIVTSGRPDFVVHLRRDRRGVDALRRAGARVVELPHPGDARDHGATGDPGDFGGPSDPEGPSGPDGLGDPDGLDDPHGLGGPGGADRRVEVDSPDPVENFLVLFTSGTTGSPKAISVSEALICARVASVSRKLKFTAGARVFMSGLLNNTTGVIFSFGALLHGATLVFPEGREPADWPGQVASRRASHIMLRPVAMKRFVAAASARGVDLSCLRVVAYGAAAMPRAVLEEGRRLIPCEWVQGYGLSETYGPFCWLDEEGHRHLRYRRHAYCVGRPDDTLEVRLAPLDGHPPGVGEIVVRGGGVMEGYLDVATGRVQPPGEWLRTGDVGEWSPDGDLLLRGRISASLMSENGHRIYPEEVEAVLAEVPGVDVAVLVGMAGDGTLLERPVACIHGPLAGRPPAEIRTTVATALERALSREKWPDLISAGASPFPTSGNDKVLRAEVARSIDRDALIELRPNFRGEA